MLRILPRYFVRELLKTFGYAFAAVILIIFVAFALQMMLTKGINVFKMPKIMLYLLLLAFPYALPTALLASVIMTYGRLAGDNEILAIRSSGIHLQWITTPTVLLGTFCSLFTLFVNGNLLPATEAKLKKLQKEAIHVLVDQMGLQHAFIELTDWEIYIKSKEGDEVRDVLVFKSDNEMVTEVIKGKKGRLRRDQKGALKELELEDVDTAHFAGDARDLQWIHCERGIVPIPNKPSRDSLGEKPKFMGIFKLFSKQRDLSRAVLAHEQAFSDPEKVMDRLRKEREMLQAETTAKQQEIKEASKNVQKFAKGVQDANNSAAAGVKLGEELESKLVEFESKKQAAAERMAAAQKDKAAKEQERKRLHESAQGETVPPEVLVVVDRLVREIGDLTRTEEQLKTEIAQLAASIEETHRAIIAVKARVEAAQQLAAKCAKEKADQEERIGAITAEISEKDAALKAKRRVREQAWEQNMLHDVRCVLNERLALAFSPLAFVLIAIPLGIMCRHGHILVGFSIGIGLLLIYYAIFMTGRVMAESRYFYIEPSFWAADGFLAITGAVLLGGIFKR